MKRIVTASNFGKTEDFTKEVLHKPLKMKRFEQAEKDEKHSSTEGQHQERQIQCVWGSTVNRNLVWIKSRQCGGGDEPDSGLRPGCGGLRMS